MNKKETAINLIGIFFLIFGLFAICYSIYRGKPERIFWFCYIGMILIGIGILKKSSVLIASQINILAIQLIFWNIDFIYFLIANKFLFGLTDYFFSELLITARIISLEHFFLIPLALFSLWLIKGKFENAWKISIMQVLIIFIITRLLTPAQYNINCAFSPCVNFIPDKFYTFTWLILMFSMIFITDITLKKLRIFSGN